MIFDCTLCNDSKGKQFGLMVKHLNKTHFMVRPFQCADCNVGFHNSALLASHRHTEMHRTNRGCCHHNLSHSVSYLRNQSLSIEVCDIERRTFELDKASPCEDSFTDIHQRKLKAHIDRLEKEEYDIVFKKLRPAGLFVIGSAEHIGHIDRLHRIRSLICDKNIELRSLQYSLFPYVKRLPLTPGL